MPKERPEKMSPTGVPTVPVLETNKYLLDADIRYVITVPDGAPENASPGQGFAPSLCRHDNLVRAATLLPSTIYDLTKTGQDTLLARRAIGQNPVKWHGQSPSAVRRHPIPPMFPFNVLLVNPEDNARDYDNWMSTCVVPPIVVAESGGDTNFDNLSPEVLRELFLIRCELLPENMDPKSIAAAKLMLSSWTERPRRKLDYQVGGHNSVTPNLLVLSTAGYEDLIYGRFSDVKSGLKPYVDQIVRTANSVLDERHAIGDLIGQPIFFPTPDLILFAPSIYPHLLNMRMPPKLDQSERKRLKLVLQALQNQEGYSFDVRTCEQSVALFGIESPADVDAKAKFAPHPLMQIRASELSLSTEALGSLAVSEFSAVVRLPNGVNRSAGVVRSLAQQIRGRSQSARKQLNAFREIQKRLAKAVPRDFSELIRRSKSGVRIVADAHLEWLDVDGLPLAIRKNVARIPVTPGNLFIDMVGPHEQIRLSPIELQSVLVIGALKRADPIKDMFEIAFDTFSEVWKEKVHVKFVEVASQTEFVNAINQFDGQILFFDGHGAHFEDEAAVLYLQDEPTDVWLLRGKIKRMPPIVILSACDTHAADRNHATVANGFVALGARAVLASVLPLDARSAASFAARLVYRLADYLRPAICIFKRPFTWLEIVSGMVRMQLLTDFLRRLEHSNQINRNVYVKVHQVGNAAINGGAEDPFNVVIEALMSEGLERAAILRELELVVANSSAISYLHIGRPETIIIDDPDRVERNSAATS